MAVPWVPRKRESRPAMTSAAISALAVRRARERDVRLRAGDPVPHLDGVAHREDVGDAGAHLVVDDDAAALADRQPRGPGQPDLRPDADAHDHDVGRDRLAGLGEHLERRARALAEAGHVLAQRQPDAVARHVELDVVGHLRVHRRHELGAALDERHVEAEVGEVLGHLEPDEAAADDGRPPRGDDGLVPRVGVEPRRFWGVALQPLADGVDVGHGAHDEDPGQVDAGEGRPDGTRTGRQDQLVVRLDGQLAGGDVAELHGLRLGRDRDGLAQGADLDVELRPKQRRVREDELGLPRDHAADVVREPAVRVRDERAALDHKDLGRLVEPAQARSAGGSSSHAADDDDLHGSILTSGLTASPSARVGAAPAGSLDLGVNRPRGRANRRCRRRARRPMPGPTSRAHTAGPASPRR